MRFNKLIAAPTGKTTTLCEKSAVPPSCFLYIDVEDVKSLYEKLAATNILLPIEKTFYGATHFFIREPGGHVLGFSQNEAVEESHQ